MALTVLDASVVIALTDGGDGLHATAVRAFLDLSESEFHLPASAYAECLVGAARVSRLAQARKNIADLEILILPIDDDVAVRAAEIRANAPALRLPDALVLACGDILDAGVVLTADHRWRGFDRVRILGAT